MIRAPSSPPGSRSARPRSTASSAATASANSFVMLSRPTARSRSRERAAAPVASAGPWRAPGETPDVVLASPVTTPRLARSRSRHRPCCDAATSSRRMTAPTRDQPGGRHECARTPAVPGDHVREGRTSMRPAWICLPAAILSALACVLAPAGKAFAQPARPHESNEFIMVELEDGREVAGRYRGAYLSSEPPAAYAGRYECRRAVWNPVPAQVAESGLVIRVLPSVVTSVPTTERPAPNSPILGVVVSIVVTGLIFWVVLDGMLRLGQSSNPAGTR